MSNSEPISKALENFKSHYKKRLGQVEPSQANISGIEAFVVTSKKLRGAGNYPAILSHGKKTRDIIVLTHGLTDSPYYMQAIGAKFFQEGFKSSCRCCRATD